ncbi:membrane protein insertion efficiency factor YidD [Alphaproteobacteria bacterium]|jgi:putative membrane protein insertion efficiency factor|nr:membrane protein insertion efficiency factor YidD [Alphaproteobacteria bacterium]
MMPAPQKRRFSALLTIVALPLRCILWLYQACISPFLGAQCRHLPTCSQYAKDALELHGPLRGSWYALKRILRCHPWAVPAFDPVPPALADDDDDHEDTHASMCCRVR